MRQASWGVVPARALKMSRRAVPADDDDAMVEAPGRVEDLDRTRVHVVADENPRSSETV